jgi:hypothetical protein
LNLGTSSFNAMKSLISIHNSTIIISFSCPIFKNEVFDVYTNKHLKFQKCSYSNWKNQNK